MDALTKITNVIQGKDADEGLEPVTDEKPENTDFKQQRIPAWEPLLTPHVAIGVLATTGVVLLCMGFFIVYMSRDLHEEVIRYDDNPDCDINKTCTISLAETSLARTVWTPPIYIYYQLENYYQNHRIFVHSRSPKQLAGDFTYHAPSGSEPGENQVRFPGCYPAECQDCPAGVEDCPCVVMYPCGLIATNRFTDEISVKDPKGAAVQISSVDIAWPSDKDTLFHAPKSGSDPVPFNVNDERFITWMRVAGLPKFRKLYGHIDQPLAKGVYSLTIKNFFNVTEFKGKKYVVFGTMGALGGRNTFLSFSFLSAGVICIICACFFFAKDQQMKRVSGDLRMISDYENWKSLAYMQPNSPAA